MFFLRNWQFTQFRFYLVNYLICSKFIYIPPPTVIQFVFQQLSHSLFTIRNKAFQTSADILKSFQAEKITVRLSDEQINYEMGENFGDKSTSVDLYNSTIFMDSPYIGYFNGDYIFKKYSANKQLDSVFEVFKNSTFWGKQNLNLQNIF